MATIDALVRSTARRVPEREALVVEDRRSSYRDFDDEVDRTAGALMRQGLLVEQIPRNPSGKILKQVLRNELLPRRTKAKP